MPCFSIAGFLIRKEETHPRIYECLKTINWSNLLVQNRRSFRRNLRLTHLELAAQWTNKFDCLWILGRFVAMISVGRKSGHPVYGIAIASLEFEYKFRCLSQRSNVLFFVEKTTREERKTLRCNVKRLCREQSDSSEEAVIVHFKSKFDFTLKMWKCISS